MVSTMDSIRITITRDCKEDGTGGIVVDDAAAVLGAMPDGTPIVDVLVAAFSDAYGIHRIDETPVSGYRNLAYRIRQFMTEIVAGFASKQATAAAQSQAQAAVAHAMESVTILETE